MAGSVQNLFQTGKTAPSGVGLPSKQIAELVAKLVNSTKGAIVTLEDPQLQKMLIENAKDVTSTTAKMITFAKKLAEDPSSQNQQNFAKAFKLVTGSIGSLVKNIREADTGEKDCLQALTEISKVQTDLDAATIFAETGSIGVSEDIDLEKVKIEYIENCKKIKVESEKVLKAKLNQNNLGKASLGLSKILADLSEQAKKIAVALVDPQLQKKVLGDSKLVVNKGQQLIMAAKMVCASPKDEKLDGKLKDVFESNNKEIDNTAKSISEKVEFALQTQKSVDSAKLKINDLLKGYATMKGSNPSTKNVISITKEIPLLTGKLVTAKQTDPGSLVTLVQKTIPICEKLLSECKGVLSICPNQEIKTSIDNSSKASVGHILSLLDLMKENKMDEFTLEEAISNTNEQIADKLADIVESIKKIPGQENLDEDDLGDAVITSLEKTQKSILERGGDIKSSNVSGDTSMGIGSQEVAAIVIESSKAIVSTISNLVLASIETQKELLQKGRANVRLNVFRKDPQWAQSIIETSDSVVFANDEFVQEINEIARIVDEGEEINFDSLIKKATYLGQITQQLVAASKRKADPNSPSGKKLTLAGKSVSEATNALLAAAKEATKRAKERVEVKQDLPFNERMKLGELGIQIKIAKYEKDLQIERTKIGRAHV